MLTSLIFGLNLALLLDIAIHIKATNACLLLVKCLYLAMLHLMKTLSHLLNILHLLLFCPNIHLLALLIFPFPCCHHHLLYLHVAYQYMYQFSRHPVLLYTVIDVLTESCQPVGCHLLTTTAGTSFPNVVPPAAAMAMPNTVATKIQAIPTDGSNLVPNASLLPNGTLNVGTELAVPNSSFDSSTSGGPRREGDNVIGCMATSTTATPNLPPSSVQNYQSIVT